MAETTLRAALAEVLPSIDDTDNHNMSDVIGNKNDTIAGDSIMALLKYAQNRVEVINQHLHNTSLVYPTLANGVTVSAPDTAWTLGNPVEIIPANTIINAFDIHFIEVEACSAADVYEIVLYSGENIALIEIGRARTAKQTTNAGATSVPICCQIQPANTRIAAKLACKTALRTLTISLAYHIEYTALA